jgi:hypothetical protein
VAGLNWNGWRNSLEYAFKDGTEDFPVNDGIEPFKGIARFAQAGVAVLKVKQAGGRWAGSGDL